MKSVKAEILTIGDELLYGQVLDGNAHWLSQHLGQLGIHIAKRSTVGDQEEDILKAFEEASQRADIVLMTGGLGPTNDDLTRDCLARLVNKPLVFYTDAMDDITAIFKAKGREIKESTKKQAFLPEGSIKIHNRLGTAAGIWIEHNNTIFVAMPGVPYEMKAIIKEGVTPRIKEIFTLPAIYHRMVKTVGTGETIIAEKIEAWEENLPKHIRLAYLPGLGQVRLRLTAKGENVESLKQQVNDQIAKLKPLIEELIFGYDDDTIEAAVGRMLLVRNLTISTAESCTGGYLAHMITSVPGSSAYFIGSVLSYHNDIKTRMLDVPKAILAEHGAVSEPTVIAMAQNICKNFGTNVGLATSGIAGPGGGSVEKPVGTVWVASCFNGSTVTKRLQLGTERDLNIKLSALHCLNLLRKQILNIDDN